MRLLTRILFPLPHDGGAHSAPARERRGVSGPRKRPSRGVRAEPHVSKSFRRHGRHAEERKFLNPPVLGLQRSDFGDVQVAS